MSKLFSTILIVALVSGVFAGCGGKVEESYQMVTVREASHAEIVSPGYKFGFDSPEFIAVKGNIGMVREGNLIEFFTGEDLENKVKMVEGKKFVAGVRKAYTPKVHFSVDFFAMGADTIRVGEAGYAEFPTLLRGFDEGNYEEIDIALVDQSTRKLKEIYDTQFKIEDTRLSWEEIQDAQGETMWAYMLTFPNVRFIIDGDELDAGMELLLIALINEDLLLTGGISYGGMPSASDFPRSYRNNTKIGGMVKLQYVKYAGDVCPIIQ
ncbi:MAG: hypothetical protein KAV42_02700 [Candidatus Krumholzibacteria bacterium]|nr:hypothetical protein [Candidatus Krumholzibacteria bacterium]